MVKVVLTSSIILQLFLLGCSTAKPVVDNEIVLKKHVAHYQIFSVGYWKPGYTVLTLTDAGHQYFVIKTLEGDSLKVGNEYRPH